MNPYLVEFLGTMLMIFIICVGSGVVVFSQKAEVRRKEKMILVLAGSFSLLIVCWLFGNSTTYFNSAVTLTLLLDSTLPFRTAVFYICAQAAGAFSGAVAVYICFFKKFNTSWDPGAKLCVFCSGFGCDRIRYDSFFLPFIKETVTTFLYVFGIRLLGATALPGGLQIILVVMANLLLGFLLDAHNLRAMDPIRDMMPRLVHAILPIRGKGSSVWDAGRCTWAGSTVGAVVAVCLYHLIFKA